MNRNTEQKRLPSLRRIKNKIGAIGILVLVCTLLSAVTMAYVFTQTKPVVNQFTPSKVSTAVDEDFVNNIKSNVNIVNTGDTEAYIRAAVVVTWVNANGEVHPNKPVAGTDYNITYSGGNWEQAADGFWYYKAPVAPAGNPNNFTTTFISECTEVKTKTPKDYYLSVEIISSGIQSTPTNVVTTEWASGVSGVSETVVDGVKITTLVIKQ